MTPLRAPPPTRARRASAASLCSGTNRRAVIAGVGVTLCFTLTGNNMIVSFMDVLLAGAGANAFWGSLGYATAQVVAALVMAGGIAGATAAAT